MNLLGIDFEDWFHPELIQKHIGKTWKTPTIINGIDKILDWLRKNETFATFFVVGELLEYKPELLDKILDNGHEIAFHSMYHSRLDSKGYQEKFDDEIKIFDKITNGKSRGFRAPSFSLNQSTSWAIDTLLENNYQYDSSVVPAKTKLYGIPNAEIKPYKISSKNLTNNDSNSKLLEFPLLTTKFLGRVIPAGGGFFLRTLPKSTIEKAIKKYNEKSIPAVFYIHSWELTPEFMPKLSLPIVDKFVTYHNIGKAFDRMDRLLKKFEFTSFVDFFQIQKTSRWIFLIL